MTDARARTHGPARRLRTRTVAALVVAATVPMTATVTGADADERARTSAMSSPSSSPTASPRTTSTSRATTDPTRIVVHARDRRIPVSKGLFGVNHQYSRNGHTMWDAAADKPRDGIVRVARRSQVRSVRFPGGTLANLYDWKRGVGPRRGCQVDAGHTKLASGMPAQGAKAFGTDEYMEFLEAIGAKPFLMVPMVTETPDDAADWVEYMNGVAGARGNPNGGRDWADYRAANGHPEPYHVTRWEMGNELHHPRSRHWLSPDNETALRQYAFGGSKTITENLGTGCRHPVAGVPSDGSIRQKFSVLYPPVDPASTTVTVDGEPWTQVASLLDAGRGEHVYTLEPENGVVQFGGRMHGAAPPSGAVVSSTYLSVHQGYFAFADAMHAVDPTIKVCASWGILDWPRIVRRRDYDCLTRHSITTFLGRNGNWSDKLEGHDRLMLALAARRLGYTDLRSALPDAVQLWISETVNMQGDVGTWPQWQASASAAAYTASLWGFWIQLGVPVVIADDMIRERPGLITEGPDYAMTARGLTRQAIAPLVDARGSTVDCTVKGMPVRTIARAGSYNGLGVTCVRGRDGRLYLLVVNRLPLASVRARVDLRDFTASRRAQVTTVAGNRFSSVNEPGKTPQVHLTRSRQRSARDGFTRTFPPASTTVLRISPR